MVLIISFLLRKPLTSKNISCLLCKCHKHTYSKVNLKPNTAKSPGPTLKGKESDGMEEKRISWELKEVKGRDGRAVRLTAFLGNILNPPQQIPILEKRLVY